MQRLTSARTAGGSPSRELAGNLYSTACLNTRQISPWSMPYSVHVAFSPDGTQMAVLHHEPSGSTCKIVEAESGRLVRSSGRRAESSWLRGQPMAPRLATPCEDLKIYVWDAATGTRKAAFDGHTNAGITRRLPPRRHIARQQRMG